MRAEELGYTREMAGFEGDRRMERTNPELTDGAYHGLSRGHLQPRWAQHIGMPRGYGYGGLGWATWWAAVVDGIAIEDVAWSYDDPPPESLPIKGHLSFDEQKADVASDVPPASVFAGNEMISRKVS